MTIFNVDSLLGKWFLQLINIPFAGQLSLSTVARCDLLACSVRSLKAHIPTHKYQKICDSQVWHLSKIYFLNDVTALTPIPRPSHILFPRGATTSETTFRMRCQAQVFRHSFFRDGFHHLGSGRGWGWDGGDSFDSCHRQPSAPRKNSVSGKKTTFRQAKHLQCAFERTSVIRRTANAMHTTHTAHCPTWCESCCGNKLICKNDIVF